MNLRLSTAILCLLVLISAGLATLWVQAHNSQAVLQLSITHAQADLAQANRHSEEEQSQLTKLTTDISKQKAALTNSPGSLETVRHASAIVVIDQLKLAHEKNPPAPRLKPPPSGPSGYYFPELLSDPEYNALYAEQERRMIKITEGARLRELGLSDATIDKIVSVLAEHQMSATDYRAISGKAGIPGDYAKQLNESRDHQLLELMGEETFKRWANVNDSQTVFVPNPNGNGSRGYPVRSHEALVADANAYLTPKLALRLSYTDTPLQKDQAQQLAEILANYASAPGPGNPIYKAIYDDAFIQQSAQVLSPLQVEALRQFKAEQDASTKRAKLPKSSELPRNTLPAK